MPLIIRSFINLVLIKYIVSEIEGDFDIVWSFDPYRLQNLRIFKSEKTIYHPVDIHESNREVDITNAADYIFCPSLAISKRIKCVSNKKYIIPHGLSKYFILKDVNTHRFQHSHTRVGFVGNLNYKYLDHHVLKIIIRENPEIEFILIGPLKTKLYSSLFTNNKIFSIIKSYSNVKYFGEIDSEGLPKIYESLDAFLLCYKGDVFKNHMANPHKILEFLSSGKVVISHYIDTYKNHRDIVEMANKNNDLPHLFKNIIYNLVHYNRSDLVERRIEYAKMNSYTKHLLTIEKILYGP